MCESIECLVTKTLHTRLEVVLRTEGVSAPLYDFDDGNINPYLIEH